jgi:hypothetical protein
MNVWLVEPYYTGSHRAWADGYQAHSRHAVHLLTMPGRFWKWRMQGGAVTLARQAQARADRPDLILASDMLNLPVFLALAGDRLARVPVALYFHENQLTYPLPPGEKRDLHYAFINWASALRADAVFFNSAYHLKVFFDELPRLLEHFPDYNELWSVETLRAKSQVLPLGLDLTRFDRHCRVSESASQRISESASQRISESASQRVSACRKQLCTIAKRWEARGPRWPGGRFRPGFRPAPARRRAGERSDRRLC